MITPCPICGCPDYNTTSPPCNVCGHNGLKSIVTKEITLREWDFLQRRRHAIKNYRTLLTLNSKNNRLTNPQKTEMLEIMRSNLINKWDVKLK